MRRPRPLRIRARLLFLLENRARLRISEVLRIQAWDLSHETHRPTNRLRQGKDMIVPLKGRRFSRAMGYRSD